VVTLNSTGSLQSFNRFGRFAIFPEQDSAVAFRIIASMRRTIWIVAVFGATGQQIVFRRMRDELENRASTAPKFGTIRAK
jgi:hypothetical protein